MGMGFTVLIIKKKLLRGAEIILKGTQYTGGKVTTLTNYSGLSL